MRCTDKEQETCQVEKMGCKGCAYYEEETVVYEDDIEAIEKVLQDLESYKIVTKKQISYLDKQIRCYERKINDILELKNQGRYLTAKERKQLKYELGRKDECVKMKNHLTKLINEKLKE